MDEAAFREFIRHVGADQRDSAFAWSTAIGLQAVDGLKTSGYLRELAVRNIEGEISFEEVEDLLENYHDGEMSCGAGDRSGEADRVSARIAAMLCGREFIFSASTYLSIHRRLFAGIFSHAGQIRDYNLTKKEWVLNGASVTYGSATELEATLDYDLSRERKFSFQGLSMDEIIAHLAKFVADLWQIHVFGEGNTRTTAVFLIKYLRKLGVDATNDVFAEHARYFRNALVRANFSDLKNGIFDTTEYLELFLRDVMLNEKHDLQNRIMRIGGEPAEGGQAAVQKNSLPKGG